MWHPGAHLVVDSLNPIYWKVYTLELDAWYFPRVRAHKTISGTGLLPGGVWWYVLFVRLWAMAILSSDNIGLQFSAFNRGINLLSEKNVFRWTNTRSAPKVRVYSTNVAWAASTVAPLRSIYFLMKTFGLSADMHTHTHTHANRPTDSRSWETLIVMNKLFPLSWYVVLGSAFPIQPAYSIHTRILFLTMSLWTFPVKIF